MVGETKLLQVVFHECCAHAAYPPNKQMKERSSNGVCRLALGAPGQSSQGINLPFLLPPVLIFLVLEMETTGLHVQMFVFAGKCTVEKHTPFGLGETGFQAGVMSAILSSIIVPLSWPLPVCVGILDAAELWWGLEGICLLGGVSEVVPITPGSFGTLWVELGVLAPGSAEHPGPWG